jgi:predicted nucleotidyltransferase
MKLLDRIDVPETVIAELAKRYHVRELAVFGSVLRDDFDSDSDIDILVEFEPDAPIGLIEHYELQQELAALLGRRVDLISRRGLNPIIRGEILEMARVVYAA